MDTAMRPIEIALDAALVAMRSGGSTLAAERSFANILKAFRERADATVWRLDFIAATRMEQDRSAAAVRAVGPIGINLSRASEIAMLGERVARGEVATADVEAEVERIKQLPSPYSRWTTVAVAAATAACSVQIPGGQDWGGSAVAFLAAGAGALLRSGLQRRGLAVAPVTLVCGLLSSLIAAAGLRLGLAPVQTATLLASVAYLVPGLPLINGFIDMISHRHLFIGAERMLNAAFLFLVIGLALAVAHNLLLTGM
jgi:uncharacterized membrane protein YjjP (DUF1212 family)